MIHDQDGDYSARRADDVGIATRDNRSAFSETVKPHRRNPAGLLRVHAAKDNMIHDRGEDWQDRATRTVRNATHGQFLFLD
jgi:hypothetical protein